MSRTAEEVLSAACSAFQRPEFVLHLLNLIHLQNSNIFPEQNSSRAPPAPPLQSYRGCSPIGVSPIRTQPREQPVAREAFLLITQLAESLWSSSPLMLHISKKQFKHPFLSHHLLFGKRCLRTFWRVTFYHSIPPSLQSKNHGRKTQKKMLSGDFYFLSIPVSPFQQFIWMFQAVMFLTSPAPWVT